MDISDFEKFTIVTADKNKYLKLKDVSNSEQFIGKPVRIILSNEDKIPEFEEMDLKNK